MPIPTSVYAEMTPNPEVMKFVADRALIADQHQVEFRSKAEAALCSPLAEELFNFPFVEGIFISGAFVSVKKDQSLGWEMIVCPHAAPFGSDDVGPVCGCPRDLSRQRCGQ